MRASQNIKNIKPSLSALRDQVDEFVAGVQEELGVRSLSAALSSCFLVSERLPSQRSSIVRRSVHARASDAVAEPMDQTGARKCGEASTRDDGVDHVSPASDSPCGLAARKKQVLDELRYEWRRLQTFVDWPLDRPRPAELAKAGFFFAPSKEEPDRCAHFCR